MTSTERVFTQTFGVVGAILERDGQILLVRESNLTHPDHGKWNQPARWLDIGESPLDAVRREVLEESGFTFTPQHLLGVYSLVRGNLTKQFGATPHAIKLIFIGDISDTQIALHDDVSETKWFSPEEIKAMDSNTLRDLDIKQEVKDYFSGMRFPLSLVTHTIVSE
jgi:ADP-ribose pyrophosphatase YjhB (NUDIX family)